MTKKLSQYLFLASIVLSALITAVSSCEKSDEQTGSVEGLIFFAGTNITVQGVNINIEGRQAVTDAGGFYEIIGIPVGNYTLTAVKEGFLPFSQEISVSAESLFLPIPMISPALTSRVHGTVKGDFTGQPQEGVSVIVLNPDGSDSELKAVTGPDGNYEILMVPKGPRKVVFAGPGGFVYEEDIFLDGPEYLLDLFVEEPLILKDTRDGREYYCGEIGDQVWMLENLAWMPSVNPPAQGSESEPLYYVNGYDGDNLDIARQSDIYKTYGALYNWEAAMKACPPGWHLPGDEEWMVLEAFLGMEQGETEMIKWRLSGGVGAQMKSKSGWIEEGNGDNSSGFNALPGGARNSNGTFGNTGARANYWTSTISPRSIPWYRSLQFDSGGTYRYNFQGTLGFSVRCLRDE